VTVVQKDEEHVELTVPAGPPGWLVLANAYSPDWKATVDGRPIAVSPTNFAAMGIPVSAGRHTVQFYLSRTTYGLGGAISLVSLALVMWAGLRRTRPARGLQKETT
jgi:uncharacterized membrane protein YfhO